jgi:hypothetical protein
MGIFFAIAGCFIFVVSALSISSDIQVGIAVGGLNLIAVGLVLMRLPKPNEHSKEE